MSRYFVPYTEQNKPAAIDIKGHRLVVVATNKKEMLAGLNSLGGDKVKELEFRGNAQDQTAFFAQLAASVSGGIVVTPPGVSVRSMIQQLEHSLPWLH